MYMYLDGIIFGIVCELSIHSETSCFVGVIQQKKKMKTKTRALYVFKNKENVLKYYKKNTFIVCLYFIIIDFLGSCKK